MQVNWVQWVYSIPTYLFHLQTQSQQIWNRPDDNTTGPDHEIESGECPGPDLVSVSQCIASLIIMMTAAEPVINGIASEGCLKGVVEAPHS